MDAATNVQDEGRPLRSWRWHLLETAKPSIACERVRLGMTLANVQGGVRDLKEANERRYSRYYNETNTEI
jgi:hypothetical protein